MFRDWFWRKITITGVKATNKIQPHRAPSPADSVRPVLMGRRYPGLAKAKMYLSENTPKTEEPGLFVRTATATIFRLKERLSLTYRYTQPWDGTPVPFPDDFLAICPAPVLPEDLAPGANVLEGLARRGPYSMFLEPDGDEYVFDFEAFEQLIPRSPYVAVGGVARFKPHDDGTMRIQSIEFAGNQVKPGDGEAGRMAELRILCALNSYTTFVAHLTQVHLCGSGTFSLVTLLALSAKHPLRILLQPFIVETTRVNNDNIDGLIKTNESNVPCYTGYSLETLNSIMEGAFDTFDLRWFDAPHRCKELRQEDGARFPTMKSVMDVWKIFEAFARAWCREHLHEIDVETRTWMLELDARIPNGITKLLGVTNLDEELTIRHVTHLVTVAMFTQSVWHFTVANMVRDYELFTDRIPTAITKNGVPTLGIMLEKRNSIIIAGILRYRLIDDVYLPEPTMKRLWAAFQTDLVAYEAALDPALVPYSVIPSRVPSSTHA